MNTLAIILAVIAGLVLFSLLAQLAQGRPFGIITAFWAGAATGALVWALRVLEVMP